MKIYSHKNIALHSRTYPGGLVNVLKGIQIDVPDDVIEHPAFKWLVDDGTVKVLVGPTEEHIEESEEVVHNIIQKSLETSSPELIQAYKKSSGDGFDAGDWTAAGEDINGYPVAKGSPEDVTAHPIEESEESEEKE